MEPVQIDINAKNDEMTTVIGDKEYKGMKGFFQSQYDTLCKYRDDGRPKNKNLEADIETYKHILDSKDPVESIRVYQDCKEKHGKFMRPREVGKFLKWIE